MRIISEIQLQAIYKTFDEVNLVRLFETLKNIYIDCGVVDDKYQQLGSTGRLS